MSVSCSHFHNLQKQIAEGSVLIHLGVQDAFGGVNECYVYSLVRGGSSGNEAILLYRIFGQRCGLGSCALHRGGIIAPLAGALKRPARDENLLKTG